MNVKVWVHAKNKSNNKIVVEMVFSDKQCITEQFDSFNEAFEWVLSSAEKLNKVIGPINTSFYDVNNGK